MMNKMKFYRVLVLGDDGVGKTSLVLQSYDLNIEDSYRKQMVIDDQPCMLEVTDTVELEEYEVLKSQWISDADGFLLVYSVTSRSSFEHIEKYRDRVKQVKGIEDAPIMLVGNKCDRMTDREVTKEEGYATAKRLACDFIETSAKTCLNTERSFFEIVRSIRAKRGESPSNLTGKQKKPKCLIL